MKNLLLLLIFSVSFSSFAFEPMMEIVHVKMDEGVQVQTTVYTDKIAEIKPISIRVDGKDIAYLSVKGLNDEVCRITDSVARKLGFSLGEMALFLKQKGTYLKCTENFKGSFVFLIEIQNRN